VRQRLKLGRISLMEHERWTCKTAPSHLIKIKVETGAVNECRDR